MFLFMETYQVYQVGLIRILSIQDERLLNLHGHLIEKAYPELRVRTRCIPDQPCGIFNPESEEVARKKIIQLAGELVGEGARAILVSCAADPGVNELKKELAVPVVGAGSSAASMALNYGERIGVLNMNGETPAAVVKILGKHLAAEGHPEGVKNTLDLQTDWGREGILRAARKIKERIDAVVLACTGMSTLGIASELEEELSMPVIDPVLASGAVALHSLRRTAAWREGDN